VSGPVVKQAYDPENQPCFRADCFAGNKKHAFLPAPPQHYIASGEGKTRDSVFTDSFSNISPQWLRVFLKEQLGFKNSALWTREFKNRHIEQ